jgi:hypothetical protein
MLGILNIEEIEEVLHQNILGRIGFIQNDRATPSITYTMANTSLRIRQ